MAGLQARLDTAFGGLGELSTDNPPWKPAQQNIFRSGPEADEIDSVEQSEYHEQLRREVVSGMAMDLAEEDRPNDDGFMPSAAFCRQLDDEDELDGVDTTAALFSNEYRPAPGTEVLEHNVYDQRLYSLEGRAPMEEEEDRNNNEQQQHQPSPRKPRVIALSSRGPSKSNLRSSSNLQKSKRVSFTGIPEPSEPWVPPHKRGNYISKFKRGATLPPSPSTSPPKFFGVSDPSTTSMRNNTVPDHIVNPHNYTLYEFDEPILVGGGIEQLTSSTNERHQQPSSLSLEGPLEAEVKREEERWQGAVGGGIQFRPRAATASGARGDGGADKAALQQPSPSVVKATFLDDEKDQELEDASPLDNASGTRIKIQYRQTAAPSAMDDDDNAMIE